jgi:hypothetical protein
MSNDPLFFMTTKVGGGLREISSKGWGKASRVWTAQTVQDLPFAYDPRSVGSMFYVRVLLRV